MGDPHDPTDPLPGLAQALDLDPGRLAHARVVLAVEGEHAAPEITLRIELFDGPTRTLLVPERFIDDRGPSVDVRGLLDWLGLENDMPTPRIPLVHGAPAAVEDAAEGTEAPSDRWLLVRPGEYRGPRAEAMTLGTFPGEELAGATLAGAITPPPTPSWDDPDSWPDTLEAWLEDLDARLQWDPRLTAADYRALYGGVDSQFNLGEAGYWDPKTDSVDPAMEEALRIREVPGAFPAPEALPDAAADQPAADTSDDDLPLIPIDNRVAIEAEPEPSLSGCVGFLVTRWVLVGGLGVIVVVALLLLFLSRSDDSSDPVSAGDPTVEAADPAEPAEPEESAADVLRRATDELLDARAAEVEQSFSVAVNGTVETDVAATGTIDFDRGDAQSTVEVEGTSIATYLDEMVYAFDPGTGWVEADPGELNENEDAVRLGLGAYGIGEAVNPIAVAHLAAAAEQVEEVEDGVLEGEATLPVTGPGAMHVDNWSHAVIGRGQEELAGLGVRLRFEPRVQSGTQITLDLALDDVIPFLGDDPEAGSLRGIALTIRTLFTPVTQRPDLSARSADREDLLVFIRPLTVEPAEPSG